MSRRRLRAASIGHKILVMPKKSTGTRRPRARRPAGTVIPAAAFKATCLELMDHVRETGTEYVVTKHGKPVVKVVPCAEPERRALFGCLNGSVLKYERPFDPSDGEYDVD